MRDVTDSHTTIDRALEHCLAALAHDDADRQQVLARFPEYEQELTELLDLVQTLQSLGQLSPGPSFVAGARERLVARLPGRRAGSRGPLARLWWNRLPIIPLRVTPLLKAFAAVALVCVLAQGVLGAVSAAEPGGLLYGLSLRVERLPLVLPRSAEAATMTHLHLATKRLRDARTVLNDRQLDRILASFKAYENEMASVDELIRRAEGAEQETLSRMRYTARMEHLDVLTCILADVPDDVRDAIYHAMEISLVSDLSIPALPEAPPTALPNFEAQLDDKGEPANDPAVVDAPVQTQEPEPPVALPNAPTVLPPVEPGPPAGLPIPTEPVQVADEPDPPADRVDGPPVEVPDDTGPPAGPPGTPGPPIDLPLRDGGRP
jgi:hypothetical protein